MYVATSNPTPGNPKAALNLRLIIETYKYVEVNVE
jgi:hypothetical protein